MIPWERIDTSPIPGGEGELRLMRRGADFSIFMGTIELMNSRLSGSEEALASRTCAMLADQASPRLLIGGLGMGFTLRAALASSKATTRIVVAELVPAVVAWARGPLSALFAGCLDDPRVRVAEGDVGAIMRGDATGWDAILLDVDNGPDGLTRASNDALYSRRGLAAAHRALRPGGVLSVWSVQPDDAFATRMRGSGFAVEEVRVRANAGKRGARHTIWLGRKV